jgi:hypothetical protein
MALTVTLATPDNGPATGGTAVTITGTDFDAVQDVLFGDVPATDVVTVGPTEITCVAPAGVGLVDITVVNGDDEEAVGVELFTYTPVILSVTPGGPIAGGRVVQVAGAGFVAVASITLDGTPVTELATVSPTLARGLSPAHAAGTVDVVLTNGDTNDDTAAAAYTYAAPYAGIQPAYLGLGLGLGF